MNNKNLDPSLTLLEGYIVGAKITGAIVFIAVWIYAMLSWGFLIGIMVGWLPAIIVACILGFLWPLVAVGLFLLWQALQPASTNNRPYPTNYVIENTPTPKIEYMDNDIYDTKGNKAYGGTRFVFDTSTKTYSTQDYWGYRTFSGSLHNNTSNNIDQLVIENDVVKPDTKDCYVRDNLIDTQTYNVNLLIPAGGVKMISLNLGNSNYPLAVQFCTYVIKAHIAQ